jgi:hypothetical protein
VTLQPALFPTVGRYVLWYRESSRHKWKVIGSDDYAPDALGLMEASGIRNGDWMLTEERRDPNDMQE